MNPITSRPQPSKEPTPVLLHGGPWDKQAMFFGTKSTLTFTLKGWHGYYKLAAGNPYAAYWELAR